MVDAIVFKTSIYGNYLTPQQKNRYNSKNMWKNIRNLFKFTYFVQIIEQLKKYTLSKHFWWISLRKTYQKHPILVLEPNLAPSLWRSNINEKLQQRNKSKNVKLSSWIPTFRNFAETCLRILPWLSFSTRTSCVTVPWSCPPTNLFLSTSWKRLKSNFARSYG